MNTNPITAQNLLYDKYGVGKSAADAKASGTENMFMTLLVTQLKNQDPMAPLENAEFIQQMAQFSSLQETQKLNGQLGALVSINEVVAGQNAFTQSAMLMGKNVEYEDPASGTDKTGLVTAVRVTQDGVVLEIDGKDISLGLVSGIVDPAADSSTDSASDAADDAASDDDTTA